MAARNRGKCQEEKAFCSLASRLCPELNDTEILRTLRTDDAKRRARVNRLRRRVRSGDYQVHPGLVAASLLVDGGLAAL